MNKAGVALVAVVGLLSVVPTAYGAMSPQTAAIVTQVAGSTQVQLNAMNNQLTQDRLTLRNVAVQLAHINAQLSILGSLNEQTRAQVLANITTAISLSSARVKEVQERWAAYDRILEQLVTQFRLFIAVALNS